MLWQAICALAAGLLLTTALVFAQPQLDERVADDVFYQFMPMPGVIPITTRTALATSTA
jgi:hypothetical protein